MRGIQWSFDSGNRHSFLSRTEKNRRQSYEWHLNIWSAPHKKINHFSVTKMSWLMLFTLKIIRSSWAKYSYWILK